MQCVNLSSPDKSTILSAYGDIIRQMSGLSKRSPYINLLRAMNLDNVSTVIGNYTKSFLNACVVNHLPLRT